MSEGNAAPAAKVVEEENQLPAGWSRCSLDDLGTWTGGGTPSKGNSAFWDGDIPWVSPKDMKALRLTDTLDHVSTDAVEQSAAKLFSANSIAFVVRSGILEHTLPISLIATAATANQDLKILTPWDCLNPKWLLYALRAEAETIRRSCRKDGTTVASIDYPRLKDYPMLIPPRAEQDRIVKAIESAMAAVDEGEGDAHKALQKNEQLRSRILDGLLQEGAPATVGELVEGIEAGKSFRCDPRPASVDEWGVVKVSAMTWGEFDSAENKTVTDEALVDPRWEIKAGDLLVSRANTTDYVGASVLVRDCRPKLLLSDKSLRLHVREGVHREWLQMVLSGRSARRQISKLATGNQDSMRNISQAKLKSVEVQVPSINRQREIAEEVRACRDVATNLQSAIEAGMSRAQALRRSILHQAFTGQLVPQDPSEEPALELLERIKAEKETREAELNRARKKTRSKKSARSFDSGKTSSRAKSGVGSEGQ